MKIFKSFLCFALVFIMLSALALPLAADVIFTPTEDAFYAEHRKECSSHHGLLYFANSEEGYIFLYESPKSSKILGYFANGKKLNIYYTYTDSQGNAWGIRDRESGWFKMSELSMIYNNNNFVLEHEEEFTSYTQGTYNIKASKAQPVVAWSYPGGPLNKSVVYTQSDFIKTIEYIYTDDRGNVWGTYSYKNIWICLSDPYSTTVGNYDIRETEALRAEPLVPTSESSSIPNADTEDEGGDITPWIVAGALVVLLLVTTAIMIVVLFKRKPKAQIKDE